jgi:ABC-type transport system substrate-binding protein
MEDVSLRLETNPAIVELWQRHRALCSGLIAFLTPLALAVTVTIGAAEKWEMSADGMTWTFLLRKGITFHWGIV